jgi:hypothetical protein
MRKHIFRLSVFTILIAFAGSVGAKEVVFIGTSMKTLAGLYKVTYGFGCPGCSIGIGPNGSVSLKAGGAPGPWMYERRFVGGKITYFSRAGFVVKFNGPEGPFEMRFVFQNGYPTSFFHDERPAGVTIFTRQ